MIVIKDASDQSVAEFEDEDESTAHHLCETWNLKKSRFVYPLRVERVEDS